MELFYVIVFAKIPFERAEVFIMYLDSLRYFLNIIEEKSISKAAQKVHVSQSAMSQLIHKLEEDLGYEMLFRSNKGVSPTPRGEIALKYAQKIVKNYDQMLADLRDFDANRNQITIIGTRSLSAYSLPCMIYRIKKKYPAFSYKLIDKNVDEIIADVRDGLADFGFIDAVDQPDPQLEYHKLGQEKVVLVAKADYHVKETLRIEDLVDVELIMCTMDQKICLHLDAALKPLNMQRTHLNVIFNADSMTSVISSVLNGYGMAFVPYEAVKHELYKKNMKVVEVPHLDLNYDIYMVSRTASALPPTAQLSREYLLNIGRKSFC